MVWISVGVNIAFAIGALIMGIIVSVRKLLRNRRTVVVHFGNGRPSSKISQEDARKLGFTGPEPPLFPEPPEFPRFPESAYPPAEDWPKSPSTIYEGPGTRAWADRQNNDWAVPPNVRRREMGFPELPEN
jgi:hypothetical protein